MYDFEGKIALVTGASSATGSAICDALSRTGCTLVMTYRHNNKMAQALSTLSTCEHNLVVRLDVTDEHDVARVFETVSKQFGRLDFLINVASFFEPHLWNIEPTRIDLQDWKRALDVDLTGSFLCAKYAIPLMMKAGKGRIINFGSSGSMRGDANTFAYNSAKYGLVGLTKSLARSFAPTITSNIIAPGSLNTGWVERWGLTPDEKKGVHALREMAMRHGEPGELAAFVVFLLSTGADYINGQLLYFDGGLST